MTGRWSRTRITKPGSKITFPASGRIRDEVPVILQDRRDVRGCSLLDHGPARLVRAVGPDSEAQPRRAQRAAHEQRQQQAHNTGQYHDDTDDVHVQAMAGALPREGRRSGVALPAGVRADGCTAGRDARGVLGAAALSAG